MTRCIQRMTRDGHPAPTEREPEFARAILPLERLRVDILLGTIIVLLLTIGVLFTAADAV